MTDFLSEFDNFAMKTEDELEAEILKNAGFGTGGVPLPELSPSDMQAWLSAKSLIDPEEVAAAHAKILAKYK